MISVVIAAHNEEAGIGRTLAALLEDARPGEFEVVVVCNGCTDRTADIARSFGGPVSVVEIPEASKVAALNRGDQRVTGFPRFYLDADVALTTEDVRRIRLRLRGGDVLAASSRPSLRLSERPWTVRAYYRLWERLPQVRAGLVGAGVYAVTETGRRRWGLFPDVLADDFFVQQRFAPPERAVVEAAGSVIEVPRTLGALIDRKTRVFAGNREVADHLVRTERHWSGWMRAAGSRPELLPAVFVYLLVNVLAKARVIWHRRRGVRTQWHRDGSSRATPTARVRRTDAGTRASGPFRHRG